MASGIKGRIFQTEGRADCRLEEGRAGVCLIHCCVPTPGTEVVPMNTGGGGKGGREELGVSRALEMQEGMRSERLEHQSHREALLKPKL